MKKPPIVLIIPRGEAVRNFVYSDTIKCLSDRAELTVLSVVTDQSIIGHAAPFAAEIIALHEYPAPKALRLLRTLTENAHDRWLWSQVAKNNWDLRALRAKQQGGVAKRHTMALASRVLAISPILKALTRLENELSLRFRPTHEFDELFDRIQPSLVFNGSHIHGVAAELPMKLAKQRGICTAGFIFSWDNLTSRSRIFVNYDHYLVWHEHMRRQLVDIYPEISFSRVHLTGTPQFDFHFRHDLILSREALCRLIGIDSARPYILYTCGVDKHFQEEYRTVKAIIEFIQRMEEPKRPQLVVRTYAKGTDQKMLELAANPPSGVAFPKAHWNPQWYTPCYEDLKPYTSMLHHAALGINPASTVTLELLLLDKPVINLGFDPPGSLLPYPHRWIRHLQFDHYYPVVESGAVRAAYDIDTLFRFIEELLANPNINSAERKNFVGGVLGADGKSGIRVASTLLKLANGEI